MKKQRKICVDCKHYKKPGECWHPHNLSKPNRVSGDVEAVWCCDDLRLVLIGVDVICGVCGRRGRWYEARKTTKEVEE